MLGGKSQTASPSVLCILNLAKQDFNLVKCTLLIPDRAFGCHSRKYRAVMEIKMSYLLPPGVTVIRSLPLIYPLVTSQAGVSTRMHDG